MKLELISQVMETCPKAVAKWGQSAQMDMVVEECAELIEAIMKRRRSRVPFENVIEEAADVFNMVMQVRSMAPAMFDGFVKYKMDRLQQRIDGNDDAKMGTQVP